MPEPMHLISNMEALTYLAISSYDGYESRYLLASTIDFDQLIEACPTTLTHLSLSGIELTFNEPVSNPTSIEFLSLYCISLDQSLANAIETIFPQLVDLRLFVAIEDDVTLSLPNHDLEYVSLRFSDWQIGNDIGFVITTTDDDKVEYYLKTEFESDDECGQIYTEFCISSISREKLHSVPVLRLTCASIDDLYLEAEHDFN